MHVPPLAANSNNLLSLAIGPQKLVTIINISNAALAPSQSWAGSELSLTPPEEPELLQKTLKHLRDDWFYFQVFVRRDDVTTTFHESCAVMMMN